MTDLLQILFGVAGAALIIRLEVELALRSSPEIDAVPQFPLRALESVLAFVLAAAWLHQSQGSNLFLGALAGLYIGWQLALARPPKRDPVFSRYRARLLRDTGRTAPVIIEWFHSHGHHLSSFQSIFLRRTGKYLSLRGIEKRTADGSLAFVDPHLAYADIPAVSVWDAEFGLIDPTFYLPDIPTTMLLTPDANGCSDDAQEDQ